MWMGCCGAGWCAYTPTDYARVDALLEGEVSRRRRGLDEALPEKNCKEYDGELCNSFAFPADAPVAGVFNQYTTISEFFADTI